MRKPKRRLYYPSRLRGVSAGDASYQVRFRRGRRIDETFKKSIFKGYIFVRRMSKRRNRATGTPLSQGVAANDL
jgi:hypothetical protein